MPAPQKGSSFDDIPTDEHMARGLTHWVGGGSFEKKINKKNKKVPKRLCIKGLDAPRYRGWTEAHVMYTSFDGPSAGKIRYLGHGDTVISPAFDDEQRDVMYLIDHKRQFYPRACKTPLVAALACKKRKIASKKPLNAEGRISLEDWGNDDCVIM
jgi:hypothetical protein